MKFLLLKAMFKKLIVQVKKGKEKNSYQSAAGDAPYGGRVNLGVRRKDEY